MNRINAVAALTFGVLAAILLAHHTEAEIIPGGGYGPKFCEWVGHSPFCRGYCPTNTYKITTAKFDPVHIPGLAVKVPFGKSCVTGSKKLCCGIILHKSYELESTHD